MNYNKVIGLLVILFAYSATWFLLFKSIKIIETIDKDNLKGINEIKDKLNIREERE